MVAKPLWPLVMIAPASFTPSPRASDVLPTGVEPTGVEPTGRRADRHVLQRVGRQRLPEPREADAVVLDRGRANGSRADGRGEERRRGRSAHRQVEVGVRRDVEEGLQSFVPLRQVAEVHLVEGLLAAERDVPGDERVRLDLGRGRRVARLGVLVDGDRRARRWRSRRRRARGGGARREGAEVQPDPGLEGQRRRLDWPCRPRDSRPSTAYGLIFCCCRRVAAEHARVARGLQARCCRTVICAEPLTGKKPAGS